MDTPSGTAFRRARWHETLAKFDLTVVYVPEKDKTVAHCLSRWAYPASKGMTGDSPHGDEAETAEAKKIIDMERMMEEDGPKCFIVMVAEAPLGRRVSRAVRVLDPEGAESDKHLFLSRASKTTGATTMLGLRLLSPSTGPLPTLKTGRSGPRGLPRKMASCTRMVDC